MPFALGHDDTVLVSRWCKCVRAASLATAMMRDLDVRSSHGVPVHRLRQLSCIDHELQGFTSVVTTLRPFRRGELTAMYKGARHGRICSFRHPHIRPSMQRLPARSCLPTYAAASVFRISQTSWLNPFRMYLRAQSHISGDGMFPATRPRVWTTLNRAFGMHCGVSVHTTFQAFGAAFCWVQAHRYSYRCHVESGRTST